ncbi:hypothetical protein PLESTM_001483000 [Pleodorina starrii]|nr:hypothetical protein PLESTM_001483000 [Pleodorina starrii]
MPGSPSLRAATPCSVSSTCLAPLFFRRHIYSGSDLRLGCSLNHRRRSSPRHLAESAPGPKSYSQHSFRAAAVAPFGISTGAAAAAAAATAAVEAIPMPSSAGTLWATCLVLFCGAFLTGLPPVLWWDPSPDAGRPGPASGMASLLQGPSLRMLSAGLMLGSGLGVVVPEGFFTFVEKAPPEHTGLPEWSAGAAMLAGFVGMLALQLWLEGRSHAATAAAAPAAAAAAAGAGAPSAGGTGAAAGAVGDGDADGGGSGGGIYSRGSVGWRQRWDSGYSALPSTAVADVETARSAAAAVGAAAGTSGLELGRRKNCTSTTTTTTTAAAAAAAAAAAPGGAAAAAPSNGASAKPAVAVDGGKAMPSPYSGAPQAPPPTDGSEPTAAAAAVAAAGPASLRSDAVAHINAPANPSFSKSSLAATAATAAAATAPPSLSSAEFALGGLLVHSAADGMAVGAASLGGGGSGGGGVSALTLAVVAAIMLHKLPVTLGLTTYLREAGWRRGRVLQALLAFSASAPLSALASFYLLGLLLPSVGAPAGDGAAAGGGGSQAVALAVLFSGGTFLAAATQHILPAALAATLAAAAPPPQGDSCGAHGVQTAAAAGKGSPLVGAGEGAGGGSARGRLLPLMWLAVGAGAPLLIAALLPEV